MNFIYQVSLQQRIKSIVNPSPEQMAVLMQLVSAKQLKKKELFVQAGKVCTHLGFIQKGFMRLSQWQRQEDRTLNFYGENEFVSVMPSFQLQQPSDSAFEAITDTELLVISHADLYQLFDEHHVWERLGRLVAEQKLKEMNELRNDVNYKTPTERYLDLVKKYPSILREVPVQYIASYLGVTRVHLTRIRKQLMLKK